ncbi:MAG: hypothetical protein WCW67_04050 [Candidatus Margulisiibacteriota bacterium]|jgi:hypothetical protein
MLNNIKERIVINQEIDLPNPILNGVWPGGHLFAIIAHLKAGKLSLDKLMRSSNKGLIGIAIAGSGETAALKLAQKARGTPERQKVGLWRIIDAVTSQGELKTTLHYRREVEFLEELGERLPEHAPLFNQMIAHLPPETKVYNHGVVVKELFITYAA